MKNKITYEEGIAQLEEIVNKLEGGQVSLEESFVEYEKGVKLYKQLKAILDEGEARIIQLTDADDKGDKADAQL